MSNEWLEIAWINFSKAILHGQRIDASGREIEVEQVLTEKEREQVYDLNQRQADEMKALLFSFVKVPA